MRVGNFSVLIPEGRERESGHVELNHEQQYRIQLGNHCYDRRCDATVNLDGKEIGTFRVYPGSNIILERSAHDSGKFTFFLADTVQAERAGVAQVDKVERGLLTVVFQAERKVTPTPTVGEVKTCGLSGFAPDDYGGAIKGGMPQTYGSPSASFRPRGPGGQSVKGMSAGITGLTGHSDQGFVTVANLDYDPTLETTINLRLVGNRFAVRPLTPSPKGNPVPSAVE